jgi:hypothetical protein
MTLCDPMAERLGRRQDMSSYMKDADSISRLSPAQFRVTQQGATERPFDNAYWDHKEPGIYVDIVSGVTASTPHRYASSPLMNLRVKATATI